MGCSEGSSSLQYSIPCHRKQRHRRGPTQLADGIYSEGDTVLIGTCGHCGWDKQHHWAKIAYDLAGLLRTG
jgi:hypothetical protein